MAAVSTKPLQGGDQALKSTMDGLVTLLQQIQVFGSSDAVKFADSHIKEYDTLNDALKEKDSEIEELKKKIEELNEKIASNESYHKDMLHNSNQAHATHFHTLEEKQKSLEKEISELKAATETAARAKEEKDQENDKLRQQKVELDKELEQQKENVKQRENKILELVGLSKEKSEKLEKLETAKESLDRIIHEQGKAVKTLENSNSSLRRDFDVTQKRLEKFESFTQELRVNTPSTVSTYLETLWNDCINMVQRFFQDDLEERIFKYEVPWKQIRKAGFQDIPLPLSNSPEAKKMRMAVVLSMIGHSLYHHIFTPSYLWEYNSGNQERALEEVLTNEALEDATKEQFYRSILLSISSDDQEAAEETRRSAVITDVMEVIQGLFSDGKRDEFQSALEAFVTKALDMWIEMRNSVTLYYSDLNPTQPESRVTLWRKFSIVSPPRNSAATKTTKASLPQYESVSVDDRIVYNVFPQILCLENERRDLVFPGILLTESQIRSAAMELEKLQASSSSPTSSTGLHRGFSNSRPTRAGRTMSMTAAANASASALPKNGVLSKEPFLEPESSSAA